VSDNEFRKPRIVDFPVARRCRSFGRLDGGVELAPNLDRSRMTNAIGIDNNASRSLP
jgi:hypothetical protein